MLRIEIRIVFVQLPIIDFHSQDGVGIKDRLCEKEKGIITIKMIIKTPTEGIN